MADMVRAVVQTGPRQIEIREFPRPTIGPDDGLLRIERCGICGSDVHGYDGSSGRRIPPLVMGHEAAGTIAAVSRPIPHRRGCGHVATL